MSFFLLLPGGNTNVPRALPLRASNMARRGVYASNPALSPTQPAPPIRRDSYTLDDAQVRSPFSCQPVGVHC